MRKQKRKMDVLESPRSGSDIFSPSYENQGTIVESILSDNENLFNSENDTDDKDYDSGMSS